MDRTKVVTREATITAFGIVLVLIMGIVDYLTGVEISLSIFYLIPISLIAWFAKKWKAIFAAAMSAVVLLEANFMQHYSHPFIAYWNAAVRLGIFVAFGLAFSRLKIEFDSRTALIKQLESVLEDVRQAQKEVQAGEEKLRLVTENIKDFFWLSTPGFEKMVYVSPIYEQIWGRTVESLYRSPGSFMESVHIEDREQVAARITKRPPEAWDHEYRILQPGGSVRWIRGRCYPIRNEHGDVQYIAGIATDTTEQKKAEETRSLLASIIESSDDAIYGRTLDGIITSWNAGAEKIYGYSAEEAIGHPVSILLPPDRSEELAGITERIKRGEHFDHFETVRVRKDGQQIDVSLTVSPIKDRAGKITGASSITRDITDRKRMEAELLKIQKLESVGILAGGIAHDFNNILTGILGNISLAKLFVDQKEKTVSRLDDAEKACIRAKGLTQQLITFAKGGAPVKKLGSISALLKDVTGFALTGSSINSDLFVPDDLWASEFDEGQIGQAINNLIINAREAMPGGGTIKVYAENVILEPESGLPLSEGRYVKISIQDEGVGISEENLAKIFDPYFTTKEKGQGLGLAVTYSIIKNHDGHITVESQTGIGTTFHIYLPAIRKAE